MYGWLTFYHHGHEVAKDYKPHMTELQTRIQKVKVSSILMFGRDEEIKLYRNVIFVLSIFYIRLEKTLMLVVQIFKH